MNKDKVESLSEKFYLSSHGHLKEKKLGGTEIHHHYNNKYDGDRFNENHEYKIVNVKAGREKGTYKFDGQLGEWK